MSLLAHESRVDLNDPKYGWINPDAQWIMQNEDGKFECVDKPEDGILCLPGCGGGKLPEYDEKTPNALCEEVDKCGCHGSSGSDGGGGTGEGVTAETVTTMIQEQTPAIVDECMNDFASGQIETKAG